MRFLDFAQNDRKVLGVTEMVLGIAGMALE
jgi:hypothetical protein